MTSSLGKKILNLLPAALVLVLPMVPAVKSFLLKGLLLTGIFNARSSGVDSSAFRATAPVIQFTDGKDEFLTTGLRGKTLFINFWADWCPPCVAEMGGIERLYQSLENDPGIQFILLHADGNLTAGNAFMAKSGYSLPVYRTSGPVSASLFDGTLPTTVIIDTSGRLLYQHSGLANYDTEYMRQLLKQSRQH